MDVTAGSHNGYNWDDLSIGYGELDQSRQFFARKHIKHEKFYTDCVNFKNAYEKENKKNLPNIQREREDHPNIRRSPVKAITPDNKPILEDKNKGKSKCSQKTLNTKSSLLNNKNVLSNNGTEKKGGKTHCRNSTSKVVASIATTIPKRTAMNSFNNNTNTNKDPSKLSAQNKNSTKAIERTLKPTRAQCAPRIQNKPKILVENVKKNIPTENIERNRLIRFNIKQKPDASGKADQKGNYNKVLHKDSDKKITSVGTSSSTQANIAVNQKSSRDKMKRRSKSVPPVRFSSFKKEQRVLFSLNENESSSQKARRPRNLLINSKEFEDLPNIKFGKTGPQTVVPSAFLYSEKYQKNRNEKIKKSLEEDKKKRVFHSKPAPNFRAIHEANFQKKQVSEKKLYITAPATPLVLKKSQEYGEKKKKVIEEYEKRLKEQKFVSRPANVIYDEPFQPKKEPLVLETKPFNLHVEKRLEERKKYDEEINKLMETKKKEEELRRKKEEEECIKKIRKQAVFKAQKNPFK